MLRKHCKDNGSKFRHFEQINALDQNVYLHSASNGNSRLADVVEKKVAKENTFLTLNGNHK